MVIGDVSGKGAPGRHLCGPGQWYFALPCSDRAWSSRNVACGELFLGERRIEGQFVSLIYAVWDDDSRSLQVANSGLPRPVYCHDGKIEIIEATGLPLGLFDDAEYDEFTFKASPGDLFVFFSDGILDASNKAGDLFGRGRVETIVAGCAESSADCVVKSLFKAVTGTPGEKTPSTTKP